MAESLLRNRRGCKRDDLYNWKQYNPLELDTVLTVQLYLQQLVRDHHEDIDQLIECPPGVEEELWAYEHLRQVCLELNSLAVRLQTQCLPTECINMQADGEEVYLCAAHKKPKECSAIDYVLHTLDGSSAVLNNTKLFPSRVTVKPNSMQRLEVTARRIYRIFSHAYFKHRKVFDTYESETQLCVRFTKFGLKYDILTVDTLTIPMEFSDDKQTKTEAEISEEKD